MWKIDAANDVGGCARGAPAPLAGCGGRRALAAATTTAAIRSATMPVRRSLHLVGRLVTLVAVVLAAVVSEARAGDVFSNSFLVRFRRDVHPEEAHRVAARNGFVNMGPVSNILCTFYHCLTSSTHI